MTSNNAQKWNSKDDDHLIVASKEGEDEAFGELVRRYQGRLRGYASQYISDSHETFELVQDAFLKAYRHINRFDESRPFYPWIRTILHNLVLNHFRRQSGKRKVHVQLIDSALCEKIMPDPRYGENENIERIEALRDCIAKLPKSQQELLRQRYSMSVAVQDIADRMQTTAGSISMRLLRIRKRLKNCMNKKLQQVDSPAQ